MAEKKIKSLDELRKIREQNASGTALRTTGEDPNHIVLAVGLATCGIAAGARDSMQALLDGIAQNKLTNVSVVATGCIGLCYAEPIVEVRAPGKEVVRYGKVDKAIADEIITKHVMHGELVDNAIIGREVPRT